MTKVTIISNFDADATRINYKNARFFGSISIAAYNAITPKQANDYFLATDDNALYIWNGSALVAAGGGASNTILQSGATYPTATSDQLALPFLFYQGYNYPSALRLNRDIWLQTPAPVVQTEITDISNTELRLNWNVPTYVNYLGNTVNADVGTYYWEVYSDVGLTTLVQNGSTSNLTQLVTGLTINTTYYTRIAHGDIAQGSIAYSNTITASTTNVLSIYTSAVALSPQYAYNFEPIAIDATTVANQGTEVGTSIAKSGTFTKNVGLVSGASARLRLAFAELQLGHTDQSGIDWLWISRYVQNGVSGEQQVSLYDTTNLNNSRVRISATGFTNNPAIQPRNLAGINFGSSQLGAVAGDRIDMIIKIGNEIKTYVKGSTTPVNTIAIPAGTSLPIDVLRWFESSTQATNLNIEAIYFVFAHGSVVTNNEQDWIDLMLLPTS